MATNSDASLVICDANNKPRADELKADMEKEGIKTTVLEISLNGVRKAAYDKSGAETLSKMSELHSERRAMMLFTSGTVCGVLFLDCVVYVKSTLANNSF